MNVQQLENLSKKIQELEAKLRKLENIKEFIKESESGCASCDFAVAVGWCASCYDDEAEGEKLKKDFINGKITFGELFNGANWDKDENCRWAYEFLKKKFRNVMNVYFTELEGL